MTEAEYIPFIKNEWSVARGPLLRGFTGGRNTLFVRCHNMLLTVRFLPSLLRGSAQGRDPYRSAPRVGEGRAGRDNPTRRLLAVDLVARIASHRFRPRLPGGFLH